MFTYPSESRSPDKPPPHSLLCSFLQACRAGTVSILVLQTRKPGFREVQRVPRVTQLQGGCLKLVLIGFRTWASNAFGAAGDTELKSTREGESRTFYQNGTEHGGKSQEAGGGGGSATRDISVERKEKKLKVTPLQRS